MMQNYLHALKKLSATGVTTEHSFRGPLETLINTLDKRFTAVNEPRRQACGAPDYVVLNTSHSIPVSIGYMETKDTWVSLDKIEETDQFARYIGSLDNLILTNYIEFRRFVRGDNVASVVLGKCNRDKTLDLYSGKEDELRSFLHDFLSFPVEPVTSARDLAVCMAKLTHAIRETVLGTLDSPYKSRLEAWREAFARMLVPDLMQDDRKTDFADMYAQTIAYGFFAARCHHDSDKGQFERHTAQDNIPKTNPLLRSLFASLTGPELGDEPYCRFVEDLIQVLSLADMSRILEDFGERDKRNDPVIHFYETFLSAYDPELREKRGIYYTPEPVVSWLVRSADAVVRKKFSIPQGLADSSRKMNTVQNDGKKVSIPKVLILDPSCGTGTFLYKTIELIRERLTEQGQGGMWSAFVRENLLPRILGFELLMAPYAVAHFKLSLQLAGHDLPDAGHNPWKYDFSTADRLRVYLTNTLEELEKGIRMNLPGFMQVLTGEEQAALEVKQSLPVLVIMGNPPYSGESANASSIRVPTGRCQRGGKPILKTVRTMIGRLIEEYKQIDGNSIGETNSKWLQDDYVKFIRWAQWKLEKAEEGVITFVTNHGYLDNPTFRGMRYSLLRSFDEIYIYDLHGNSRKKEKSPDGSADQNVFDIQQGVAMCVLVKCKGGDRKSLANVYHAELFGSRESKYNQLFESDIFTTSWKNLQPTSPNYLFIPQNTDMLSEYDNFTSITEMFPVYSNGIVTARDRLAIHYTADSVWQTINEFINLSPEEARIAFSLGKDAQDWKVEFAQADIKKSGPDKKNIVKVLYRPFDIRYTYYTGKTKGFICRPRFEVMNSMTSIDDNIGMITSRLTKGEDFNHIQATNHISEAICLSSKTSNNGFLFPLYIFRNNKKHINISQELLKAFEKHFPVADGENIFYYTYSILNTPLYQKKFSEFLRHDFPKIPLPRDEDKFEKLVRIGKDLVSYYTLAHRNLSDAGKWVTQFPHSGTNTIDASYPSYSDCRVSINPVQYFSGVPAHVWNYTIGGYQPAKKWLKDRRGRTLALEDIQTYQQIILAISETIRLRKELDDVWSA